MIQPENPNRCVIKSIQHTRSRGKIIQFFRDAKITTMKYHAKNPARIPKIPKPFIVFAEWVGCWDGFFQSFLAEAVGEKIQK